MLPGPKADRIAIRCEECRMTQAAEIPLRLHKRRIVRRFQIMRPDKHSVNSAVISARRPALGSAQREHLPANLSLELFAKAGNVLASSLGSLTRRPDPPR